MAFIKKLFNQLDSADQRLSNLNKSTKEVFEDMRRWNTTTGYKIPYQRPRLTTNYETNNFDPSAVAEYLNNFASEEQDNRYGGPFLLSDRKKREFYGRTTRRKSQSPAYNENYRKESHLRNDDQKMEQNEDVETELEPLRKETINFEPQQEDPPIDNTNQIETIQNIEIITSMNNSTARERLDELRRAETMKQNREFQKLKLKNTMIVALVVEDERVRRKAHIKEKLDSIGRPQGILLPDNQIKDPISLEITSDSSVVHTPKTVRSSN
ncbi:MAG: hypothetical protein EZS28_002268 [Streblomastix strix]|uniref:Uncharacterized protein n=1 Tax=Streblomastix strix TaxID=222440 RepID=A0A5J4X4T1_9EUKA|nr:MAG: hypothetical protein EZS28_002268 [Streblomastix strix]